MQSERTLLVLEEWQEQFFEGLSLDDSPAIDAAIEKFTATGQVEIVPLAKGLSIKTTSYVGFIRLGNLQVSIQPKIKGLPFLHLLRYAYGLRNLKLSSQIDVGGESNTFQDLLILQLILETNELFARGLHRNYVQQREQMSSPRGKIDIQSFARSGGTSLPQLPMIHYPHSEDTKLNQVLLAGLLHSLRLTSDMSLKTTLRQRIKILQEQVSSCRLDHELLDQAERKIDRMSESYVPALQIVRLLFEGSGASVQNDRTSHSPGFLFDMNRFFQAVLGRFLRDNLPEYHMHDEYRLKGMLAYLKEYNPRNQKAPVPRPDFVLFMGAECVAVLDAKYRDVWKKNITTEMLYQLALYTRCQKNGMATILYPTLLPEARESRMEIRDPFTKQGFAQIIMRPVNLLEIEKLVVQPRDVANVRAKFQYARWLALGDT